MVLFFLLIGGVVYGVLLVEVLPAGSRVLYQVSKGISGFVRDFFLNWHYNAGLKKHEKS
jgi:hypothetical protein